MEVKGVGGGCGVVGKVTLELEIEGKLRGGEKRVRCVMREVELWVVEEPVTGQPRRGVFAVSLERRSPPPSSRPFR